MSSTNNRGLTPWYVHLLVFLLPVLFGGMGWVLYDEDEIGKGISFVFALFALYSGAFAILYGCWMGLGWLIRSLRNR